MPTPEEEEAARQAAARAAAIQQAQSIGGPADSAANQATASTQTTASSPGTQIGEAAHYVTEGGGAAVKAIGGAVGIGGSGSTAKINPYDPDPQSFNLMGDPHGATALANAYDAQKVQAQQAGADARTQTQQQAATYGTQGAGIQTQQGKVAAGNQAQGAANAAAMGASAADLNRIGTNANFRAGTNVGYGGAEAYGQLGMSDRAAAMGLANRQIGFADQGPGPSAAQAQLQMGSDRAQLQNLSLARSGRGMGQNAAALRGAVAANSDVQAQTNQQAALLRAQEADAWRGRQLQAYGQAQQGLQGITGATLQSRGMAGQEAQYQAQLSDAQRARNDAAAMGYAQLGLQAQQFGQTNQLGYNQLAAQNLGQGYQYGLGYNQLGQQALGQGMTYDLGAQQLGQQYAQMGLRSYEDQLAANQAYEQLRSGNYMTAHGFNAGAQNQHQSGMMGLVGTGLGLLSDIDMKTNIQPLEDNPVLRQQQAIQQGYYDQMAEQRKPKESGGLLDGILSDERNKRQISELQDQVAALGGSPRSTGRFDEMDESDRRWSDFLSQRDESVRALGQPPSPDFRPARGYSYEYKDPSAPGAAHGRQVGPMAQDLQHIPGVVKRTPQGLAVDGGRLTMANTAALSQTQRQNEALKAELASLEQQVAAMGGGQPTQYPTPQQPPDMLSDANSKKQIEMLTARLDAAGRTAAKRDAENAWLAQQVPPERLQQAPATADLVGAYGPPPAQTPRYQVEVGEEQIDPTPQAAQSQPTVEYRRRRRRDQVSL